MTLFPSWRAQSPHRMVVVGQTSEWKMDRKLVLRTQKEPGCQRMCGPSPVPGPIRPLHPSATPRLSLHLGGPRVVRGANRSSSRAHLKQRHLKCPLAKQVPRPSQWTTFKSRGSGSFFTSHPPRLKAVLLTSWTQPVADSPESPLCPAIIVSNGSFFLT